MKRKKTVRLIFTYILCILFTVLCLFPIWVLFVNATRSTTQIQTTVSFLPSNHLIENYRSLMAKNFMLYRAFFNSLFISVTSTGLSVYFSALTAYGLYIYNFKGKNFLFKFVLVILMIPGQLSMVGFYQFMLKLNLYDSYIPLIVPSIAAPSTVFFLKQYLESVYPKDLTEATRMDGANEFLIFNRITVPIVVPALATMSIFGMVYSWNNYVMPLILLNTQSKFTMPMLVQLLRTDIYATDYGALYLGLMLTILPLIVIYLILSKAIIRGVALGGIKE
ncbi:MAG: carbohydrate ABC transporter permease [Eubacteriales bacterium]